MADTMDKSGEEHLGQTYDGEVGRYQIEKIIGAGGMGVVCLGETEGTGRKVAVKFLHRELANESDSSRERFEREIKVLRDLKAFRGVVQIEDVGHTPDGAMFLVMEYITGRPLNEIIEENPKGLPQMKAVQTIIEILIVLEPIHRTKKFIHRDLKPHNICVYDDPLNVRLLDFGLSKPFQEGSGYERVTRKKGGKAGEIPGSPHYMPEEQFLRPKEVDRRTDLYAVGIILYELLAGVPPFRGIYLQEILKQHRDKEAPPIDTTAEGGPLSYRLWTVIEKALAKSPESRYQTATEFREALEDVLKYLIKREQPKKSIDTRYRIVKKIGEGGNSEVFEAEDLVENRSVALKIVKEGSSDWDEETLVNEADRALNHDNIVKVHDFGLFEGRPALVMDFVQGGTVAELVKDYGEDGLPEAVFYRVAIDSCKGLHHAHQANIVHRDVKPENMLRTLDGRIKMADFGIAKRFETSDTGDVGSRNTVMAKGTAPYMSPEQCDLEGKTDRRADVYSLGCVIYEMLTGQPPFTEGILLLQHLQNDPPPLKVKGDYKNPDELCRIVERCLKKRKDERYQSMKELAQDLVRVSKLKPQKKAHKAIALDTGADTLTAPDPRGLRDSTQTNLLDSVGAGRPAWMKVAMILAPILVIGGVAAFMMGGGEDPVGPRPPTNINDSSALIAANELSEKIGSLSRAKNWDKIASLDLAAFEAEEAEGMRENAAQAVISASRASFAFGITNIGEPGVFEKLGQDVAAAGNAVTHLDPSSDLAVRAAEFAALAAKSEDVLRKDERGFFRLDEAWFKKVQAAGGKLEELRIQPGLFMNFQAARSTEALEKNVAVIQERLGRADEPLSEAERAELGSIATALQRARGPSAVRPIYGTFAGFVTGRLASLENPQALPSFVKQEADALLVLDLNPRDSVFDFLAQARNDVASSSPPPANSFGEVAARALATHVQAPAFLADLSGLFDVAEPETWKATLDSLTTAGLDVNRFGPEYLKLFDQIASEELDQQIETRYSGDAGAAERISASIRGVTKGLPRLSGEVRNRLRALAPKVETSADAKIAKLNREMAEINAGQTVNVDDASELLRELAVLNGRSPAEMLKDPNYPLSSYKEFATGTLTRVLEAGRPLAYLSLLESAGNLIPSAVASSSRNSVANGFLQDILKQSSVRSLSCFANKEEGFVNAAWARRQDRCLEIDIGLPDVDREFLTGSQVLRIVPGEGAEIFVEDGRLRYLASPARAFAAIAGNRVAVKVTLQLVSASDLVLAEQEKTLSHSEAPIFDTESPRFVQSTPRIEGSRVLVVVEDDGELSAEPPSLQLGGRTIEGRPLGKGRFEFGFDAEVLRINVDEGTKLVVTARDAFGNSCRSENLTFSRLRNALIEKERSRVRGTVFADLDALPALRAGNYLDEMMKAISAADLPVKKLVELDQRAASGIVTDYQRRVKQGLDSWLREQKTGKALEPMRGPFFATVERAEGAGRSWSQSWARDAALLRKAFEERASGGGTPPPPPPPPGIKKVPLTVGGVQFIPLGSGRKVFWIAEQELSVSFANQFAGSAMGSIRPKTRGEQPLAPLKPGQASAIIEALNSSANANLSKGGALGSKAGVNLRFAIPTKAQWRAAAKVNGGSGSYAAPGISPGKFPLDLTWRNAPGKPRMSDWYEALAPANRAHKGDKFRGLAGNVSEIVTTFGTTTTAIGGHLRNVQEGNAQLLSTRNQIVDNMTGMRLAIVPMK